MHVPREVPLGPREFVNRQVELDRLRDVVPAVRRGRVAVGLCTGLPGVGKTALTYRYVEELRTAGAFPDGDVHVEFGGHVDGGSVAVSDGLASCLAAVGVHRDLIPAGLAGRANLWRTHTATTSLLLVLDDVTDPAQVTPFVPNGPGNAVLVTSTASLDELEIDGAGRVAVEPLSADHAQALLAASIGPRAAHEPEALADLVERCEGLPVALKVAAAHLRRRPGMTLADLAAAIGDETAGLRTFPGSGVETLAAVFAVGYLALPEGAARLYRVLGRLSATSVPADVASVLTSRPATPADLDALIDSRLVNQADDGALRVHRLVLRHAVHVAAEPDDTGDALRRVVDVVVTRAAFADRVLLGEQRYRVTDHAVLLHGMADPFADKAGALAWLDAHRAVLLAAQRAAAANRWHADVVHIAEAATALYLHRRYLVDWTDSSALGAASARIAGDVRAEARLRSFVSRAWTDLGQLDRAGAELEAALPLAQGSGDARLLASVWEMIGRFRDEASPEDADEAYRRAVDLFAEQGDVRGVAFTSYFRGASQLRRGDAAAAVVTIGDAVPGIVATQDSRMTGRAQTSLAEAHDRLGDHGAETDALDTAVRVLDGTDTVYEAIACERRADVAQRVGDHDTARRCLLRAYAVRVALGDPGAAAIRAGLDRPDPA